MNKKKRVILKVKEDDEFNERKNSMKEKHNE